MTIGLFDPQGSLSGSGEFTVGSNHLLQLDNIISRLGSNISAGWLLIYSDEPLTAWASVVRNDNNDPAIELAIADQINKPAAFVESTGTRLMIQSSAKGATFQSSLAVVNVGSGDGNLVVRIYDNVGVLLNTKTAFLRADGMYVDNDIRSAAPGTFGQIVIEVTDANAGDNNTPATGGQLFHPKHQWHVRIFPGLCVTAGKHNLDCWKMGRDTFWWHSHQRTSED